MANRRVRIFFDVDIYVYASDSSGIKGALLWAECYAQDLSITGQRPMSRRPITGRATKKLVAEGPWEYEANIKKLFMDKATEVDAVNLFDCDRWLYIEFRLNGYEQDGPLQAGDAFVLKECRPQNFQLTGQDNGNIECSLGFLAGKMV